MDVIAGVSDKSGCHSEDSTGNDVVDLLKQQKAYEQQIQLYNGDDPLDLRYKYILWIESSFPNKGLNSGLITVLEDTLSLLKDDPKYTQDTRYIALLIKYIDLQPNPLEMYQCVYSQGRGTACAILYHAWAKQCEKEKNFKLANEIYELGLSNKAEPFDDLRQIFLQFQINVGRRTLGIGEAAPNTPYREALKNLQINSQPIKRKGAKNEKNETSVRFQQRLQSAEKENASPVQKKSKPHEKVSAIPVGVQFKGRLRNGEPDTFKCPVAYFEPPDPTKLKMYPIDKIYAVEGQEFQLEEIMAMMYEKRPKSGAQCQSKRSHDFHCPVAYFEPDDPSKIRMYPKDKVYAIEGKEFQLEELKAVEYLARQNKSVQDNSTPSHGCSGSTSTPGTPQLQVSSEKALTDPNSSLSILNNQSLTVASKEAMNFVRGMWQSPSPVSVKKFIGQASADKLDSSTFKVPQPPKSGFVLYTEDSSFAGPSTSNRNDNLKIAKPLIASNDLENIPVVPKTGSILRKKSKFGPNYPPIVNQEREYDNENDLGVCRIEGEELEDMDIVSAVNCKKPLINKQPITIYSDDIDTVKTCVTMDRKETTFLTTVTPLKTDLAGSSCSAQITATTSTCKSRYVIQCDNMTDQEICTELSNQLDQLRPPPLEYIRENPSCSNAERMITRESVTLPYVPPPVNNIPQIEDEGKENNEPQNYVSKPERRELAGVLQPSLNIPFAAPQTQDKENDFADETCNTKAFEFVLPSSTPFSNQFKNFTTNEPANNENTVAYCSYLAAEEAPKPAMTTELSVILEASKERYSSSSGSSSSGQTPYYGPSRLKPVNTCSEIKEESVNELEKSLSRLQISEDIDPFCPELISKLLSHIKFPQKHHCTGYMHINHDAPFLKENTTVTLGKDKYVIEKEIGRGSYARVLKAIHKKDDVAIKYQKPAFPWEYYIACEIKNRLSGSPFLKGFIEIKRAYIFNNASIMRTDLGKYGSLIELINAVKLATGRPLKESVATYFCIQLFGIVEHLHRCKIIHGDIKPDNIVLQSLPTGDVSQICLQLIDYGRSIDMTLFPEGTTFTKMVTTDGFQCNEMKENRPWTYQTDCYGLAGTAYCVLMGDYMKVMKRKGVWQLQSLIPRYLPRNVWVPIFQDLLNIESCASIPDLTRMRSSLEELLKLKSMEKILPYELQSVGNIIQGH